MPRRALLLFVIVALLALLGAGAALLWRSEPPAPLPAAAAVAAVDAGPAARGSPPSERAPVALVLQQVRGRVELRRDGEWAEVRAGTELRPADVLRTGAGGAVDVVGGEHVVRVLAGTEVRVDELTADLTSFLLAHGLVGAEAEGPSGRALQVRAEGTDTVASTTGGRFRMSHNGEGTVAVGALAGEVRVSGNGAAVVLRRGERTLVQPGKAPARAEPVARSLLLKVAWPEQKETKRRVITVTGRTEAGALVFALGERVPVDHDGGFHARVELKEGKNRIQLEAVDVAGNESAAEEHLIVDTRGAESRFDTEDLWRR